MKLLCLNPNSRRVETALALSIAIEMHGRYSPATWAAYARAYVAWDGAIRPCSLPRNNPTLQDRLTEAYTVADLRALGTRGWMNRSARKARRRRLRGRPMPPVYLLSPAVRLSPSGTPVAIDP